MTADDRGEQPSLEAFVDAWNQHQGLVTPKLHKEFIDWLDPEVLTDRRRLLLMAFRGSGKSTVIGLYAAWQLRCDPETRILVVAADLSLAKKMVRSVKRIIERHPMTGIMKPPKLDQWAGEQFTVARMLELRDPSMLARGVTTNVTGSRADLIICDDVEVPNTSSTAYRRAELRERLRELDYVLTPNGAMLFAGTPHNFYSIYAEEPRRELGETEPFLAGYARMMRPLLDESGKSVWPERFPQDGIEALMKRSGPNRFASQMMLKPLSPAEGRFNSDLLRIYDGELEYHTANGRDQLSINGVQMVDASCWWDPSLAAAGQADRTGDASVVVGVYIDKHGAYWVHRVLYISVDKSLSLGVPQQQCLAVAKFVDELFMPIIRMEKNGVGETLPALLQATFNEQGVSCGIDAKHSGPTRSKNDRIIEALDAPLAAGLINAHRSVFESGLIVEMKEWRPLSGNKVRDDGLDALAGAISATPVRIGSGPRAHRRNSWRGSGQTHQAVIDFNVFSRNP